MGLYLHTFQILITCIFKFLTTPQPPIWISCWLDIGIIGKDSGGFLPFEAHPIIWVKDFGVVLSLILGGENVISSIVESIGGILSWTFCSPCSARWTRHCHFCVCQFSPYAYVSSLLTFYSCVSSTIAPMMV
jgi:hypothetical protein